jgi:hypothetical protein
MNAYVRFQTQLRCGVTGRPAGLFVAAGRVEDSARVATSTRELLRENLTWFNRNLVVPSLGDCDWRCIFWFRSESQELIQRMWDLVAILREEGICVRKLWTTHPGRVVYSDQHQIGAIPTRNSNALRV